MPEEINRLVTDQIADILFTPSLDGNENLEREGVDSNKIHFVGNVMIDTLIRLLPKAMESDILLKYGLNAGEFGLVTLHRPGNVDDPEILKAIMDALKAITVDIPLIFPIHPRTRQRLQTMGCNTEASQLLLTEPLGYIDFLALQKHAQFVITDSGGIQEETTFLGIPCFTVRENTERPITVTMGTNILIGKDFGKLVQEVRALLRGRVMQSAVPPFWDGHAAERIADIIVHRIGR